ncbi:antibiotic biosynthesis monooxygenase family protein [Sphingomonas prati]|uniref:Heme-degrading monooxygenase HmoA n=1 Tax=Sphingomonas prati TaxID=1843237 RepID=A0A7W9BUA9_9SPHN|nr:antibiotic biosynthesis monooxygenase [Sphingomonas prati]MBB5730243.1 heme-degrading monooxygenase HmoA [Sphingomonas prati]
MTAISAGMVAVIFSSQRTADDRAGYAAAAAAMDAAAARMPGYVGIEATRDADGFGITVSYWRDTASAAAWRDDPAHGLIQWAGRARWYARYSVAVAVVDRAYRWQRESSDPE